MQGAITFHFDSGQVASWIISVEAFEQLRTEILAETQTVLQLKTLADGREVTIFRHKVEAFEFEFIDARFDLGWVEPANDEPAAWWAALSTMSPQESGEQRTVPAREVADGPG